MRGRVHLISKRLAELRKRNKWSLQYTANCLGIAKSTYAGYESGYRQPSLEILKEITKLFGTSADYLLGLTNSTIGIDCEIIELTELPLCKNHLITIDGNSLTENELNQIVTFIRVRRNIEIN